jgi:pimeloyl-ACP methyl ester carboxylesterase
MLKLYRSLLAATVLASVGMIVLTEQLAAQGDGKGEPVKITTVDGVELHGMFYTSGKKDAPTVIFLHAIGDRGLQKNYMSLAESLQKQGYSVMVFDFRGHGKSKEVDPAKFAAIPSNVTKAKATPKKTTLELADIHKSYYSCMVNDIAAVKALLDRKNDGGACNTSSTILIGAETGATLGAVWLNSEWALYRGIQNNPLLPPVAAPNAEGKDVVACIWLSISPKLGDQTINLARTLDTPVRIHACPTVFMYGDKDEAGRDRARGLAQKLKVVEDKKYEYIQPFEVKGNTKLLGINLVQKSLNTEAAINEYLQVVLDKKGGEWVKRDFRMTPYLWRTGPQQYLPAKLTNVDPNNLTFDTYEKFIGR